MKTVFRRLFYRLSRSDILFWTLPLLMILIVIGTLAQKDLGIYAVQKSYFSSLITFIGPLPFPGGATLMSVLFVNMLMKFLFFSEWRWIKSGVIITHFGFLLLLTGGFVTAFSAREGYMLVDEGKSSSTIEDYYQRLLLVSRDGQAIVILPHQELAPGMTIADPRLPFTLSVDTYCFNCAIERRTGDPASWQGPGRFMQLKPATQLPQQEANLTGIEFTVAGAGIDDGRYVTFDKFPKPPSFTIDGHVYKIEMTRATRPLPFSITLKKFTETFHPGSNTAKSYRSDVMIQDVGQDGGRAWPTVIEMNEPLRYKGYTVYQSSFDQSGQNAFTVLNVVENAGRLFPYVSSLLIAAGLILHLILRLAKRGAA